MQNFFFKKSFLANSGALAHLLTHLEITWALRKVSIYFVLSVRSF